MSHLPADFHRRLEIKPRPQSCAIVDGKAYCLDDIEGDVMPHIGEAVLIHLASSDQWVQHAVVGFYAWPSHLYGNHVVRLFVHVVDSDGILNARSIDDIRRMDGTYFTRRNA